MLALPADTPVTTPLEFIDPTAGLLLTHVPAPVASVSVTLEHAVTGALPPIAAGAASTLTVAVAALPHVGVYDITVVPADIAVTTPLEFIEPTDGVELLHVPPTVTSDSVVVVPVHNDVVPVIGAAGGHHCKTVPLPGGSTLPLKVG